MQYFSEILLHSEIGFFLNIKSGCMKYFKTTFCKPRLKKLPLKMSHRSVSAGINYITYIYELNKNIHCFKNQYNVH